MKSLTAEVDKRAPLSQYLRAEDEDGWTVFSSDEENNEEKNEEKTVSELASKPERNPDLSVLKRIKNFLCDEATQEGSFFSSDPDDCVQNYRVDYPFYDSLAEEDENVEELPQAFDALEQGSKGEAIDNLKTESRQNETTEPVESMIVKPKEPTDDEANQTEAPSVNASSLHFAPTVLQAPETQAPCASDDESSQRPKENETPVNASSEEEIEVSSASLEASAKLEPQLVVSAEANDFVEEREAPGVVEERDSLDATPCENAFEKKEETSCVEERVESSEDVRLESAEVQPASQTFVVDFSETLAPVLERRARGEEIEELPLVQTRAKRSKDVKRTLTSESKTSDRRRVETTEERTEEAAFGRLRRAPDARLAIFRRCVDLVSQRVENADALAKDKREQETLETPTPDFVSDASSVPAPWDALFDYGESVEFVAAPCFCDLGSGASFAATTFSSSVR